MRNAAYIEWYHPATRGWEYWDWYWGEPVTDSSEPDTPATPRQIAEWAAEYVRDGWRPARDGDK